MESSPAEQDGWFLRQIQPHEAMLRAWLHSRFPSERDVDDLIQESYMRVLQARARGELRAPKAFLFATARNLAIDCLRRRKAVETGPLVDLDALAVSEESESVHEIVARNQELELLTEAIQSLPERCRQVFTLRKVYGLSQKSIAARLGISEHTVSAQLTIGLHKCAKYVAEHMRPKGGHT